MYHKDGERIKIKIKTNKKKNIDMMVQFYSTSLISLSTQMRNHYKSVNDNGLHGMKTLPVHWEEPR